MKIEQNIKKTLKVSLIFLSIGLMLGALIVFAATPSSTFYISSGIYPGAPSYTVWKEGSNYFAKDINGLIPSWSGGTNATIIMQSAFTNAPLGGAIFVEAGEYYIDTVTIPSYRTFYGENQKTTFYINVGGDGFVLDGTSSTPIRKVNIHDLTFDTASTGSSSICLTLNHARWDCSFKDLYFYIDGTTAIYIYGGCWGLVFDDLTVMGETENGNSDYGIVLEPENTTTTNNFNSFRNCFFGNIEYGITIKDGAANYVTMCGFQGSSDGWGIYIYSNGQTLSNGNIVDKCYFETVKWGVRIGTDTTFLAYGSVIEANYFHHGTRHIHLLNGTMNTTISSNVHFDSGVASIQIDADVENSNLISNQIISGGGIIDNGDNTQTWP